MACARSAHPDRHLRVRRADLSRCFESNRHSLPPIAFTGEKFPIDLLVSSPKACSGSVELTAEGKRIGVSNVSLRTGTNVVRVFASLNVSGAVDVSGVLKSEGLGEARFEHAITLRKPRVLFLSQDPAGTEEHLLRALQSAHFDLSACSQCGAVATGGLSACRLQ